MSDKGGQYYARKRETAEGTVIEFYDGDTIMFATTPIPPRCNLFADLLHSTIEVAVAFGWKPAPENQD